MKIDTTTGVNEMFEDEYKGLPEVGQEVLIAVRYRDGGIYKAIGAYIRRGEREAEDFFDGSWADDQVETIDGVEYVLPGWFAVSLDHDPAYVFTNGDVVGWMPLPEFGDGTGWNRIEEANAAGAGADSSHGGGSKPMKPLYIFDLDGTIANIDHRLYILNSDEEARWEKFLSLCVLDEPVVPIINTLNYLRSSGADIWIFTGRSDRVIHKTKNWLWLNHVVMDSAHLKPPYLTMRREGCHKPIRELKREWLDAMSDEDRSRLVAVFEDRENVVDMWMDAGVTCFMSPKVESPPC